MEDGATIAPKMEILVQVIIPASTHVFKMAVLIARKILYLHKYAGAKEINKDLMGLPACLCSCMILV